MKIYCILFDTAPLKESILEVAEKNNMQMLHQVSACSTLPTMVEMFTGKMVSDWRKEGIGNIKHGANYISGTTWPWQEGFILNEFSKNDWGIYFDKKVHKYFRRKKKTFNFKMLKSFSHVIHRDVLILKNTKTIQEEYIKEKKRIYSYQTPSKQNEIYLIEYMMYHDLAGCRRHRCPKSKMNVLKKNAEERILELMSFWDFNEPNSLFWFFQDHGDPNDVSKFLVPINFLTWVMFKDNTKDPIRVRSNYISVRDFAPTIMKKLGHDYETSLEIQSIEEDMDKDRIFFVEDARRIIDPKRSSSATACKFTDWKGSKPYGLLQVDFFRPEGKFLCLHSSLDEKGFITKTSKQKRINKSLKKALINKFKWVI
ncbi:MAG: hypothetical protein ACTSUP_09690 [Candidatus Heimdallarchaeaceae archaeon]